MKDTTRKKEHYNLYYIFKEDKEQNTLSQNVIELLWEKVFLQTMDSGPP